MNAAARIHAMLDHLTVPSSEAAVEAWLDGLPATDAPHVVSFVNAHAVNLLVKDEGLQDALMQSDTLLRDGSGMKLMMNMLGREPGANLNGTDLIPRIIARFSGGEATRKRVAVFATSQPWLDNACEKIADEGADIVARLDGFQPPEAYVAALRAQPADLIILGMGLPRQEKVSMLLRATGTPCVIVNGGAIIDFIGGKVDRAPESWRRLGVEWLYRLIREPRRLFARYVVGNAVFLGRAVWLKLSKRSVSSNKTHTISS